ncbi:acyl-CoA dehydrogenase family protein [Glaciimonas sp. PAMC28666]|uniref:acyl-CoA dehydrogenase family protein n=1 Tax=Glaciimonas sp. PAMC28666 TaxID=2807626 RepID=UPI001965523A|nr:acyl-CoA/acyl-ACP dehydrogenase [Glaciimonas sp. PAMC28666]
MDQKIENTLSTNKVVSPDDINHFFGAMPSVDVTTMLKALIAAGLDQLPMPGQGDTIARWRILAAVAAHNLSLLKLYEGHTDALAILHEIGGFATPENSVWGTWCAEPPDARVLLRADTTSTEVRLSGRKAWCSGAKDISHALVSCWNIASEPCLAAVQLDQPGVTITSDGWHAVGMADSASVDTLFKNAKAVQIGLPHAYLRRPGFWHGGAGIAACWFGAASALAAALHQQLRQLPPTVAADPYRLLHLGSIDVALTAAAAVMRESAEAIDRRPEIDGMLPALRARLAVEAAATAVLAAATRALGAGPLCRDAQFARMAADLPVFLRQSHAERDLAQLGKVIAGKIQPWPL